jgi:hypothetical protein
MTISPAEQDVPGADPRTVKREKLGRVCVKLQVRTLSKFAGVNKIRAVNAAGFPRIVTKLPLRAMSPSKVTPPIVEAFDS